MEQKEVSLNECKIVLNQFKNNIECAYAGKTKKERVKFLAEQNQMAVQSAKAKGVKTIKLKTGGAK